MPGVCRDVRVIRSVDRGGVGSTIRVSPFGVDLFQKLFRKKRREIGIGCRPSRGEARAPAAHRRRTPSIGARGTRRRHTGRDRRGTTGRAGVDVSTGRRTSRGAGGRHPWGSDLFGNLAVKFWGPGGTCGYPPGRSSLGSSSLGLPSRGKQPNPAESFGNPGIDGDVRSRFRDLDRIDPLFSDTIPSCQNRHRTASSVADRLMISNHAGTYVVTC